MSDWEEVTREVTSTRWIIEKCHKAMTHFGLIHHNRFISPSVAEANFEEYCKEFEEQCKIRLQESEQYEKKWLRMINRRSFDIR